MGSLLSGSGVSGETRREGAGRERDQRLHRGQQLEAQP